MDACKISRSYTNMLVNVITNSSIKLFLTHKWFPPLNNSLTEFHRHLINLSLLKIQVPEDHSINLLIYIIF